MNREAVRDAVPPIKNRGEQHTSPAVPNGENSTGTAGTAEEFPHMNLFPLLGTAYREINPFLESGKSCCSSVWEQQKWPRLASLLWPEWWRPDWLDLLIHNQMFYPYETPFCATIVPHHSWPSWRESGLIPSFFNHFCNGRTNHGR